MFGLSGIFGFDLTMIYILAGLNNYSTSIPEEKQNYPFYKTKTYYQNPNTNSSFSYFNKTIPRNKTSQISEKGLKIRIVSAPSEGLFRNQTKEYQESVIPENIPAFGLTAGLPVTLEGLVGSKGIVFGLEKFGLSAPYKVLDEKFGYTGENVFNQVVSFLEKSQ